MRKRVRCFVIWFLLAAACGLSQAQPTLPQPQAAVPSVSTWPTTSLLRRGDLLRITTFDMP